MVGTRRPPQRGIGDACACASVDAITSRVRLALPPPSESLRHCACTLAHGPSLSRLAHVGMAPHAHVENSCIRSGCSRSCSGPLLLRASVRPVGPWDHWNQCALFPPRVLCSFSRTRIPGSPSLRHCPRCRRPALARARGAANSGSLVPPVQIPVCVGNPDGGVQCGHGAHSSLALSKLLEQA